MFTVTTMTMRTAKLVTPAVTTAAVSIAAIDMKRTLALKRNQVILDERFIRSGNVQRLCAKQRFFLESDDLTGKTIIPFAASGGSGISKTNERLAPSCKGSKLMDGKVFKGSVGHQELAAWVEGLGL